MSDFKIKNYGKVSIYHIEGPHGSHGHMQINGAPNNMYPTIEQLVNAIAYGLSTLCCPCCVQDKDSSQEDY
jgi:hypothetical protein